MTEIIRDYFSPDELTVIDRLDLARLPQHIAVIMDGNGRWASAQQLPRIIGHRAGTESVRRAVKSCRALGITYLTLYAFSTENWERPDAEVVALMELIEEMLRTQLDELHREQVRVRHIGRRDGLPTSLREAIDLASAATQDNTALTMTLAINYSGRAEIVDVIRRIALQVTAGALDPATVDEAEITRALYAPDLPDPDLLIRTAGEMRVSNYLLWQIAYTEFWSMPEPWPEFTTMHLLTAIEEYQHRQRKFGRVTS